VLKLKQLQGQYNACNNTGTGQRQMINSQQSTASISDLEVEVIVIHIMTGQPILLSKLTITIKLTSNQ
jgi:hypothetical protein